MITVKAVGKIHLKFCIAYILLFCYHYRTLSFWVEKCFLASFVWMHSADADGALQINKRTNTSGVLPLHPLCGCLRQSRQFRHLRSKECTVYLASYACMRSHRERTPQREHYNFTSFLLRNDFSFLSSKSVRW